MGREAMGVKGISLELDDVVVGVNKYKADADLLLVTENGYGKRTKLTEFRIQNGREGLKTIHISKKNGLVVGAR